ncbi:hypothetical protein [Anatilimnocola floriformis]|uniref:hypothetical protein n=1 Tax=Anatilimnocola floriformis TaxID=2948575 RepID=UPI0020C2427F|nr:hypothetical protein [Anatilimnocola floriformis]
MQQPKVKAAVCPKCGSEEVAVYERDKQLAQEGGIKPVRLPQNVGQCVPCGTMFTFWADEPEKRAEFGTCNDGSN